MTRNGSLAALISVLVLGGGAGCIGTLEGGDGHERSSFGLGSGSGSGSGSGHAMECWVDQEDAQWCDDTWGARIRIQGCQIPRLADVAVPIAIRGGREGVPAVLQAMTDSCLGALPYMPQLLRCWGDSIECGDPEGPYGPSPAPAAPPAEPGVYDEFLECADACIDGLGACFMGLGALADIDQWWGSCINEEVVECVYCNWGLQQQGITLPYDD